MDHRIPWGGVFLVLVGLVGGCGRSAPDSSPPAALVPAEELGETEILPHPDGQLVAGKNYVYCATFQLAWNRFQDGVLGEPAMVEDLRRSSRLSEDILPPKSYLIEAGLVKNGVARAIREEMASRFPDAGIKVPDDLDEQAAVAYAYMQVSLSFREAFDRLDAPLPFQGKAGTAEVACFGARNFEQQSERSRAIGDQVTVLDYAGDDDFVLRLNVASAEDEVVLAKIPRQQTLAAALASVRDRINRKDKTRRLRSLSSGESLVVPIINVNVLRTYSELQKKFLTNSPGYTLYLEVAQQAIRFRLDENGARLESSAYVGWKSDMGTKPRQYIFDKPFLVYLKRTSSDDPYLALWIETPEVLEKAE